MAPSGGGTVHWTAPPRVIALPSGAITDRHKLFILKTSVHKRTFTKPHFVLSLLRNSVLFMIVRSLRFAELSNSHASMKFSNSGTTCELLYHFLP